MEKAQASAVHTTFGWVYFFSFFDFVDEFISRGP